jgi:aspartyl aminopeptidase
MSPGDSGFWIRGGSLVAVRIPANFTPDKPIPFHIVAAHSDSPCLRLKPKAMDSTFLYRQWGVEVYGGALFNSWLDRDLGIAGRISVISSPSSPPILVRIDEKPVRIPQLAIHLDRTVNEQGLILNPQKHLVPIFGQVEGGAFETLLEHSAGIPGVKFSDLAFDLCLFDLTRAGYGGTADEFVFSGRLDNLAMCHAAVSAFATTPATAAVQVIALFDHEEVGNVSSQGSESNFLPSLLERVALSLGLNRGQYLGMLPQSFLISADMAHALHPNYPDRHEPFHFPLLNRGVVLKSNAGKRYAGDGPSSARLLEWARRAGVSVQNFLSRNDLACGTTVGPGLSATLGVPAVDIGSPMLSMHSAREMCGADDPAQAVALFGEFLKS